MLASKSATLWSPASRPITSTIQLQRLPVFVEFILSLPLGPPCSSYLHLALHVEGCPLLVGSICHISTTITRRVAQDLEGPE